MKMEQDKIAESQRSFIYLELDELYTLSPLPEPLKKEIYAEFKVFLEGITSKSLLTEITDAVFELASFEQDRFSDILELIHTHVKQESRIGK